MKYINTVCVAFMATVCSGNQYGDINCDTMHLFYHRFLSSDLTAVNLMDFTRRWGLCQLACHD